MTKILAVSGGVDSVVLFDYFVNSLNITKNATKSAKDKIIVAHFDHGTRKSSQKDAEFVKNLCQKHQVKFVTARANLGQQASEAEAREKRYQFLRKIAKDHNGQIYTAHHTDDLIESITINILRGTKWRGLAPMNSSNIKRPFIEMGWGKKDILKYAGARQLKFRQDPTNYEDKYLRNRIRQQLAEKNSRDLQNLLELFRRQTTIKTEIEQIIADILPPDGIYQRNWFKNLDEQVALEILRASLAQKNIRVTYPQLKDFLAAIKTYAPEKIFNLPSGKLVKIHKLYYNI
ncbi:tRNA lysidine(34) synthetase TilS [Candidatus Saccharibacteria bacterium]|nr:tRNA lysidine(34) synthetase TilS [Candidatus Saccharibacteria bacterium]